MCLEKCSPSTSEKYRKRRPKTSMMGTKAMCFGTLVLVICTVVVWYLVLAPANVVSAHKKMVNEKLEQLTVSIQKSKEMVTAEFEDLTKSLGSGHDELISKMESENKLLQDLAETLKKETQAKHEEEIAKFKGTEAQHEEEIAKFKTDRDAEVAKLHLEVSTKQLEITHLKDDINNNKDALEKVKAIIDKTKVDLSLFCAECVFDANGMKKTTCGKRKEYLMDNHKTEEDVAIEAVMTWDPDCKK